MRHLRDKCKWINDGEIRTEEFYNLNTHPASFRARPDPSVLIYTGSILVSYILLDYIESHVIIPIIQNTGTEE